MQNRHQVFHRKRDSFSWHSWSNFKQAVSWRDEQGRLFARCSPLFSTDPLRHSRASSEAQYSNK